MESHYRPDYSQPEYAARIKKRKQTQDHAVEDELQPTHQHKRVRDKEAPKTQYGPSADRKRRNHDRKPRNDHRINKKSSKDRKENRSTRIRSLKNLLGRGALPATIHQEKERELAALLFDQQKDIIRQNARKNLKRYHFIRFVERQKATRTVKQLKKQQEAGDSSEELKQKLHEAEVDLNYTIYAPLAQKYVAIYARDDSTDGKARPLPRNLSHMPKIDYAILSDEQKYQIELVSMEAANLLHLADSASGTKPPMWYVVESKMKEGEKSLEELREQQDKVNNVKMDLAVGRGIKKTPDWLTDDGMINPEDLDSDSDADGGVTVATAKDNEDEEMSDGDGGFFEKR